MATSRFQEHTAEAIRDLFGQGINDPPLTLIAKTYYQGVPVAGPEVRRVRDSLPGAVRLLREEYGETLHLVTEFYYKLPKRRKGGGERLIPEDTVTLRRCLPLLAGRWPTAGIRRVTTADDRLYLEFLAQEVALGAGQVRKVQQHQVRALRTGILSDEAVGRQQRALRDGAMPDRLEDRERLLAVGDAEE